MTNINQTVTNAIKATFANSSFNSDNEYAAGMAVALLNFEYADNVTQLIANLEARKNGAHRLAIETLIERIKATNGNALEDAKRTARAWYNENPSGTLKEAIGKAMKRITSEVSTYEELTRRIEAQIAILRESEATEYVNLLAEFYREVQATSSPAEDTEATDLYDKARSWYLSNSGNQKEALSEMIYGHFNDGDHDSDVRTYVNGMIETLQSFLKAE